MRDCVNVTGDENELEKTSWNVLIVGFSMWWLGRW